MRFCPQTFDEADAVAEEPQAAMGANARIEHPHGSGRDVATIGKQPLSLRGLLLVETYQIGVGHVDLAAHFEHRRNVPARQTQRHAEHGADIVRDVVANSPIAARGAVTQ